MPIMLHFKLFPLKLLKFCKMIFLISFPVNIQVLNTSSKDNLWTTLSLLTVCLYHKYFKNYKLLNMMTLKEQFILKFSMKINLKTLKHHIWAFFW